MPLALSGISFPGFWLTAFAKTNTSPKTFNSQPSTPRSPLFSSAEYHHSESILQLSDSVITGSVKEFISHIQPLYFYTFPPPRIFCLSSLLKPIQRSYVEPQSVRSVLTTSPLVLQRLVGP